MRVCIMTAAAFATRGEVPSKTKSRVSCGGVGDHSAQASDACGAKGVLFRQVLAALAWVIGEGGG